MAPRTLSGPGLVRMQAETGGPITLIDHRGRPASQAGFRGKFSLLYFGYTFCPDICPTSLQTMAEAVDLLEERGSQVQPIFITVDPKRDTPSIVGDYATAFHDRMIGLTGSEQQIETVARDFGVAYRLHDSTDENYLVDHSSYFYLMDANWSLVAVFQSTARPEQIADVLRSLL